MIDVTTLMPDRSLDDLIADVEDESADTIAQLTAQVAELQAAAAHDRRAAVVVGGSAAAGLTLPQAVAMIASIASTVRSGGTIEDIRAGLAASGFEAGSPR